MRIKLYICMLLIVLQSNVSFSQTGWYQQTLPVTGTISDMQFINAQTGWITLYNPFNFLKTTNGGKIWNTLYPNSSQFIFFDFIDNSIGYAIGYDAMFNGLISKTNNGGLNWITVYTGARGFTALDFVNQDTGWFGAFLGDDVQILRTTNGGQTLELQYSYMSAGQGINEVFFVDKPYDGYFYGWFLNNGFMSKTTNSGFTWSTPVDSVNGLPGDYYWLFFLEKDTGWVVFEPNLNNVKIYKTQNGGTNWVEQINSDGFAEVRFINQSVGWAGSGSFKIYATKNGGNIWGTQVSPIFISQWTSLFDSLTAWTGYTRLAHTTDGGGIITYVGIDPTNTEVPIAFQLKQNYPNPFNPQTTIEFSILNQSRVSLILYDITGKEILMVYDNQILTPGNYKVSLDFSKKTLSSGTYFYSMKANDNNSGSLYNETRKMIYVK